jgi:glycosyltransferase involved in cell wall biosynthesis
MTKKKVIVGFHSSIHFEKIHDTFFNIYASKILKKFDAFHVTNTEDQQVLKSMGFKHVHFIPNYVLTQEIPRLIRPFRADKPTFVFVGRYEKYKGLDLLLEAIKLYFGKNLEKDVIFEFYGSGSLGPLIDKTSLEFPGKIHNYGYEYSKSVMYQSKYFLIFPSWHETFGLVLVESMCFGTPVITSNMIGSKLLIHDGDNGLLIKALSPGSILQAMERALNLDDYERLKMGESARVLVNQNYTEALFLPSFCEAIKSL